MSATATHPTFNDAHLLEQILRLRVVDNVTNLGYLAREYLGIAAVIAAAIGFAENRAAWGLPWAWNVPVFAVAVMLIGGFQHRLAGLGHEASHYSFLKNKFGNDLVADLFCMFPILTTVHFYRVFHMAHHQYTNDPERDPDLVNLGPGKGVGDFPMPRWRFILRYYLRPVFAPLKLVRYEWDYTYVNIFGKGGNVYMKGVPDGDADDPRLRLGTVLGLLYLAGFIALQWYLTTSGRASWLIPGGLIGSALVVAVTYALPARAVFRSPFRQPYSPRFAGMARLVCYTLVLVVLGLLRDATGGRSSTYFWTLWVLPIVSSFSFFMMLRDVYQHTNADRGRLTNSRVFLPDPFTRWAVFVYGQDMHIPHHLFPAIPHYRLPELHALLKREHPEYAAQVVECRGTFANRDGRPTILDVLCEPPTRNASGA